MLVSDSRWARAVLQAAAREAVAAAVAAAVALAVEASAATTEINLARVAVEVAVGATEVNVIRLAIEAATAPAEKNLLRLAIAAAAAAAHAASMRRRRRHVQVFRRRAPPLCSLGKARCLQSLLKKRVWQARGLHSQLVLTAFLSRDLRPRRGLALLPSTKAPAKLQRRRQR